MVALDDSLVQPHDTVDVGNGVFMYAGSRMTDHNANHGGYGRITAEQAIWFSSNIGVAKLILRGYSKNPTAFVRGLHRIGMTANLRLEIPGAGHAKIRWPNDKRHYWSQTTLPWMSFGYETQIPPIYTLSFFNAIANGGKMVSPKMQESSAIVVDSMIAKKKNIESMQKALRFFVTNGLGKKAESKMVNVAGTSGSIHTDDGIYADFCGYFPVEKPKYTVFVSYKRPEIPVSGGGMAGQTFRKIAELIMKTCK